MKKKFFYYPLLLTVLGIFCFLNNSEAQIEDFKVGTTTRQMLAYAPSTIVPGRPLVISMHGYSQDIAYQKAQTKWDSIAKIDNFVVVFPNGVNNAWDLGGNSDIDFIIAIIDEMYERYGIDTNRVYLSGFSMGAMMSYTAVSKIGDKIAAIGPVSAAGGTTATSSRPIPIIHTHGTADNFSSVQPCLDAWIKRNNCPTTAQVINPYPAGSTKGDTKSIWGPGDDSVEVVLISLNGKDHFHSIEPDGVNTTAEIWNFCKRYSLDYGLSKYLDASVGDANPKQIQVTFSKPLKELTEEYKGFSVKIGGSDAEIDTVILSDSVHFAIKLTNNIVKTDEILLSYSEGNIVSVYNKDLVDFQDKLVDNQLYGSAPKFVELYVTANGDSLIAGFNKKMLLPSDLTSLALIADFEEKDTMPLNPCSFLGNDSTKLVFTIKDTVVYADYQLYLSYTGNNVVSSDGGLLKNDTAYVVTNNSKGLPVHIISGILDNSAIAITLVFSKPMSMTDSQIGQLSLKVNGQETAIKEVFNVLSTIKLNLFSNIKFGDTLVVTYTPGDITAKDKGALEAFTDVSVTNTVSAPTYTKIPGKIEAENYTLQFGTDTETTSDAGGGLNVGWLDADDWLVYAIENNTEDTVYKILFRLATSQSGKKFDYFIDDVKIGQIDVPNTGDWQKFQSVVTDIVFPKGKHYFKILDVNGNFNINYFAIQKEFVSSIKLNEDNIRIYPNPASEKLVIESTGFQYDKIEIMDIMGKTVLVKDFTYAPELMLPLNLSKGTYFIKISNGNSSYTKMFNVVK